MQTIFQAVRQIFTGFPLSAQANLEQGIAGRGHPTGLAEPPVECREVDNKYGIE
jgi:hypothetical protein